MKQAIGIIVGVAFGTWVGLSLVDYFFPETPPATPPAAVTVDASDSLTYRPVRALGNDWYLVEVAYPHTPTRIRSHLAKQ